MLSTLAASGVRTSMKMDDGHITESEMPQWPDSSSGVHTLVVFDDQTKKPDMQSLAAAGGVPDFIWGGLPANVPLWRQLNPNAIVSKYLSFAWVEFHNGKFPLDIRIRFPLDLVIVLLEPRSSLAWHCRMGQAESELVAGEPS